MYYATKSSTATTLPMAGMAPQHGQDTNSTGFNVLQYPTERANTTPQRMLHVIALALDMNPECYRMKTRIRNVVEMRFIASVFLRQYFPALTLQQIAAYFGGQDHSSVINGITRAYNLLHIRDAQFLAKYNAALKSVTAWMDRMTPTAEIELTESMAA